MTIYPSGNDTKFSGDEPGIGIIISRATWAGIREMDEPGQNGAAARLGRRDRIWVSDAAWRRAEEARAELRGQ